MKFLKPKFAQDWLQEIKQSGIKSFIKKKGWKFLIAFFLFYLIRDTLLYIVIPYLAVKGIISCE